MLCIKSLNKTYGNGVQALSDVSLDIPKGLFGLLGPNGAGKSTLMRSLATLQEPDSGSISMNEVDWTANPQDVKRRLGYLPQEFGFPPRENALSFLNHLCLLKGIASSADRQEVVEGLLRKVNLWDVRKQKLAGYSGGMRQRLGIAQALIGNPRLVIVDEPTAGLDPEERVRFHNLLSEIGQDVVVLLSTHIVDDVSDLCPQMAILHKGSIVFEGETRAAIVALKGQVWEAPVEKENLNDVKARHRVLSTRLFAGQHYVRVLDEKQPAPEFEAADATLEDVYFSYLGRGQRAREAK